MKTVKISAETVGKILGYIIVLFLIFFLAYAIPAFIAWNADPGMWTSTMRMISIVSGLVLFLGWLFLPRIVVLAQVEGDDAVSR